MKPEYRSSRMPRVLGCNGSITLEPMVNAREGDEGFEGVQLHWEIANKLIQDFGAQPPEGGLPPPQVPPGYKLPKSAEWMVGWAIRHVLETIPDDWALLVECEIATDFPTWKLTGHQDLIAISPDGKRARGKDWKTGVKPVEPAPTNEQVNAYMVQDKLEFPDLEEIEFEICQPRVSEEDGFQRVTKAILAGDALKRAAQVLDERVIAAHANRYEINSGFPQCDFCPVGVQCPAIQAMLENMKIQLTPEMLAKIRKDAPDATLGDIIIAAKILDRPIEDARDIIKERLEKNPEIVATDGTRITAKTSKGAFKILDPVGLYATVRTLIPDEARLAKALSFPMGRLTDALAEQLDVPRGGKAAVTAEGVAAAQLHPYAQQGIKTTLQFS